MSGFNLKEFILSPKIVFLVLGIIIIAELVYFGKALINPFPAPAAKPPTQNYSAPTKLGRISLKTTKAVFSKAETIPISVMVDTAGQEISGADLIIRFDPNLIAVPSGAIVKGSIFDDYPLLTVDSEKGIITVSGINNSKKNFKGQGQFALINLKARRLGKTILTIDFNKGDTKSSNLVAADTAVNILEKADNLELTIQ